MSRLNARATTARRPSHADQTNLMNPNGDVSQTNASAPDSGTFYVPVTDSDSTLSYILNDAAATADVVFNLTDLPSEFGGVTEISIRVVLEGE